MKTHKTQFNPPLDDCEKPQPITCTHSVDDTCSMCKQPPQQGEALPPWKASGNFTQADADACNKAETKQGEHSPLPWHLSHEYGEGFNIAREIAPNCGKLTVIANVQYSAVKYQPTRDEAKANAKLIVASVNHADKLATALRRVSAWALQNYEPAVRKVALEALAAYERDIR